MNCEHDVTAMVIGRDKAENHATMIADIRREVDVMMNEGTVPLEPLSRRLMLTRGHLNRKVRARLGITLQQLVTAMKLDNATALLRRAPELKMHEVATLSGFDSAASFSRAFRRVVGMAPTTYAILAHSTTEH